MVVTNTHAKGQRSVSLKDRLGREKTVVAELQPKLRITYMLHAWANLQTIILRDPYSGTSSSPV